ncbi:MAG TPA: polyprenyl synthetase family protein [Saprospiraceae bacterium]|nr:polyprenyl synthetase family protein [Saprospiraceae bacterium]
MTLSELAIEADRYIQKHLRKGKPPELYAPIQYCLDQKGKRVRASLALIGCGICSGEIEKAFPVAAAVEIFHNFTLLHDDIMDAAPVRRGQPSVFKKYGQDSAILSGDLMMIEAYRHLAQAEPVQELLDEFNKVSREVCEGQQLDMNFEVQSSVALQDYLEMIRLKTSVLLASALKMGAMTAQAPTQVQEQLYDFGLNLGLAFQIQDDYLDSFGDPENFGKQVGGDILQAKKMVLFALCMTEMSSPEKEEFLDLYQGQDANKVEKVLDIFIMHGIDKKALQLKHSYEEKARQLLADLQGVAKFKDLANQLVLMLSERKK